MTAVWTRKRWVVAMGSAIGSMVLTMGVLHAHAQDANAENRAAQNGSVQNASVQNGSRVQPQATAEDVLASLVHHSAVIFAGEVYAIRLPQTAKAASGVTGGMPSSRPDAVDVEFRVDMGIRGASIGSNYVLHMPLSTCQQAPAFTLHQRSVTFLKPPDTADFAGPVEGEADLPGLDLGVMPVDNSNQVDLSRLQRLVTRKTVTTAAMLPPAGPPQAPSVAEVSSAEGKDTLISGSSEGRMPELRNSAVPFLALVRDVTVLSAAESPTAKPTAANPTAPDVVTQ